MALTFFFLIFLTAAVIGQRSFAGGLIGACLIWGGVWVIYSNLVNWGFL